MGTDANKEDRNSPEYLASLLKDKKQIQSIIPNVFVHIERLLDDEINRVRLTLFHHKVKREALNLPDTVGPIVTLSEKVYVPVKDFPDFNFVGRILGPRGMTAKDLEQFTGCKIMVRGKGSMRDKKKVQEDMNRGKANWEHLNEDLHVLLSVEDTRNRAEIKLQKAVEEVKKLLVPAAEGEDDLKKRQLMELAIMNGTYRELSAPSPTNNTSPPAATYTTASHMNHHGGMSLFQDPRMLAPHLTIPHMRSPTPAGAPIILAAPRMSSSQGLLASQPPPLISPGEASFMYSPMSPYDYGNPYALAAQATLLDYNGQSLDHHAAMAQSQAHLQAQAQAQAIHNHNSQAQAQAQAAAAAAAAASGAVPKLRRTLAGVREHPYTRVTTFP